VTSHLIFMTLTTFITEHCSYTLQHCVTRVWSAQHGSVLWCSWAWQLSCDIPADAGLCVKKLPCSGMWQQDTLSNQDY